MHSIRLNVPSSVLVLLFLIQNTPCPAWTIDTGQSCTWGIANSDLSIPADSVPVGAILTLHHVYMDTAITDAVLNLYLLGNPQPGLISLTDNSSSDPFEGYATPIGTILQWDWPASDLTIDLSAINSDQSKVWSVFENPFSRTLGSQQTVTWSSALLELMQYSGAGSSFGFGFYSRGFYCSGLTLQITIQSLTETSPSQVITYPCGNRAVPQFEPVSDYTVNIGRTLEFTVTASDSDPDTVLTYSAENLPQAASFAGQTFTWTPAASQEGTWPIVFRVTDGTFTATQTVTITVTPPAWSLIINDDFESGMGNWIDGGTHCARYVGTSYAYQGKGALNLQDNTSTSVATTNKLALAGYTKIKVDFVYKCISMDSPSEDFWLQISTNGGTSYITAEEWNLNDEFVNGRYYQESVIISGFTLTDQTRIRFRCDAGSKDDDVYIDAVTVSAQ